MRFLLVDKVLAFETGVSIVGIKQVAMSEDYLTWHFPERPILPGNLIMESAAQLAGWLEAASSEFTRFVLMDTVRRARFLRFVVPGERVTLAVTRVPAEGTSTEGERRAWTVEATVDDARCATFECEGACVDLDTLDAPEDAQHAWTLLRGEETDA